MGWGDGIIYYIRWQGVHALCKMIPNMQQFFFSTKKEVIMGSERGLFMPKKNI